jgi:hypothetical protein
VGRSTIRSTTPIGAKGRGRQLRHREAMEQTSQEEVKSTGKVARTLKRAADGHGFSPR